MSVLFIMILTRIFGSSATDVQIYLGFVSGILIVMSFIARLNRETGEMKIQMKNSFDKVKDDIANIKKNIQEINRKLKIR